MQPAPLAIVVTRNTLLLVTYAVTLWRLWGLRDAPTTAENGGREPERPGTLRPPAPTPSG